jgi:uncharacterized membrane protein
MGSYQGRRRARAMHQLFGLVVVLKGLDGLLEFVGGAVLLLVPPDAIATVITTGNGRELSEHAGDFPANLLRQ